MASTQVKIKLTQKEEEYLREQSKFMGLSPSGLINILMARANHSLKEHGTNKVLEACCNLQFNKDKNIIEEGHFVSMRINAEEYATFQKNSATELSISGTEAIAILFKVMSIVGLGSSLAEPVETKVT